MEFSAKLDTFRQFDTCTIANAIERFRVRLRSEGFTRPGLRCVTGGSPRFAGYADTFRVRSVDPPMSGSAYLDRSDWWQAIAQLPTPRIAVTGEVHAAILKAFACEAAITNGAARDIPAVSRMSSPMLAAAVSVSHAYMHILEFGAPVDIFGLPVRASIKKLPTAVRPQS